MSPQRIQRSRTRGWRMPEGAVYVGRGSAWGNPFAVASGPDGWFGVTSREHGGYGLYSTKRDACEVAVHMYRWVMRDATHPRYEDLTGRDLACWCPLNDESGKRWPCHADFLLSMANPGWTP